MFNADTLYSVEVLPNCVKYYGVELDKEFDEDGNAIEIAKIPTYMLKELMKYASENHEYIVTATIHNNLPFVSDEQTDKEIEETMELISEILKKTRG